MLSVKVSLVSLPKPGIPCHSKYFPNLVKLIGYHEMPYVFQRNIRNILNCRKLYPTHEVVNSYLYRFQLKPSALQYVTLVFE